jgi:hypothetical protein
MLKPIAATVAALVACLLGTSSDAATSAARKKPSLAPVTQTSAVEFLTAAQQKEALRKVDIICGDTFCAGDYNYRFLQIACNKKLQACRVYFKMWDRSKPRVQKSLYCDIRRIASYNDIVPPSSVDLSDSFYDQMNDCTTRLEKLWR